ncbi:TetR/AcrR family transcriptional regulator [Nocardia abscessus]|uniref:TetR/AcrR family transcriptional regulator n=2 Tax=Nocardia abscessus TaxID=120957 RepID=UPI0024539816|nr:TetR/AcrR family transcriptional regulator [Nocardia abscessus]
MTEQSEVRPGPGRPRDPQLDEQVLRATQELLVEKGFQATTIQGVARRAGVVATSIYRRWPNKIHLVEDAIFALETGVVVQPTGDIAADLLAWTRLFFAAATHPAARSGIPGLLSAYHDDEQSYRRLRERGEGPARVALRGPSTRRSTQARSPPAAIPTCSSNSCAAQRCCAPSRAATRTANNSAARPPPPWSPWPSTTKVRHEIPGIVSAVDLTEPADPVCSGRPMPGTPMHCMGLRAGETAPVWPTTGADRLSWTPPRCSGATPCRSSPG